MVWVWVVGGEHEWSSHGSSTKTSVSTAHRPPPTSHCTGGWYCCCEGQVTQASPLTAHFTLHMQGWHCFGQRQVVLFRSRGIRGRLLCTGTPTCNQYAISMQLCLHWWTSVHFHIHLLAPCVLHATYGLHGTQACGDSRATQHSGVHGCIHGEYTEMHSRRIHGDSRATQHSPTQLAQQPWLTRSGGHTTGA